MNSCRKLILIFIVVFIHRHRYNGKCPQREWNALRLRRSAFNSQALRNSALECVHSSPESRALPIPPASGQNSPSTPLMLLRRATTTTRTRKWQNDKSHFISAARAGGGDLLASILHFRIDDLIILDDLKLLGCFFSRTVRQPSKPQPRGREQRKFNLRALQKRSRAGRLTVPKSSRTLTFNPGHL